MEVYAQTALTLLLHHRCKDDLKVTTSRYPHAAKFRQVYNREMAGKTRKIPPKVFTERNIQFLQNIQNCRSNSLRCKVKADELASKTDPFEDDGLLLDDRDNDEDEDDNNEDVIGYESFMEALEDQCAPPSTDHDSTYLPAAMKSFKFSKIRERGKRECGFAAWCEPEDCVAPEQPFLQKNHVGSRASVPSATVPNGRRVTCTVDSIVKVLLRRVTTKSKQVVWKDKSIDVTPAIGSTKSVREWSRAALGTDKKQQRAFESIISAFILTFYDEAPEFRNDATTEAGATRNKFRRSQKALRVLKGNQKEDQLTCLLHGPGSSGKSTVINLVIAYAKEFCLQLGHPFQARTIVVTAMSGVAATLLNGETTYSALALNKEPHNITQEFMDAWDDNRLTIIDEISFAAPSDIKTMYENAKIILRENFKHYGGSNMVFAGDYSQLVPVNKECIYNCDEMAEFQGIINCFIELDGTWRFKDDPFWGKMMKRFREGVPTLQDIHTINDNCHVDNKKPPSKIQVATHTNKDRDAVNTAIFEDYCQHNRPTDNSVFEGATMIFMDSLCMETSVGTLTAIKSNMVKRHFYENCSEDFCKIQGKKGRVDPCLKLYPGCPMMLTLNKDVSNGEANGSRVFVQSIDIKFGESPFNLKLDCGTTIQALFVSQVESITVRHENQDICPPVFKIEAKKFSFKCELKVGTEEMKTKMSGIQFPIISNSCTTGHKLQGCTVTALLANDWHYVGNWAYVVLSRVKTMAGLYLRQPLVTDLSKYAMSDNMKHMIHKFKQTCALQPLSDEDYEDLCTDSEYRIPIVTQSP